MDLNWFSKRNYSIDRYIHISLAFCNSLKSTHTKANVIFKQADKKNNTKAHVQKFRNSLKQQKEWDSEIQNTNLIINRNIDTTCI